MRSDELKEVGDAFIVETELYESGSLKINVSTDGPIADNNRAIFGRFGR